VLDALKSPSLIYPFIIVVQLHVGVLYGGQAFQTRSDLVVYAPHTESNDNRALIHAFFIASDRSTFSPNYPPEQIKFLYIMFHHSQDEPRIHLAVRN